MNQDLPVGIITALAGLFVGFFGNYFIAKLNARNELKKSISEHRAMHYLELWKLCDRNIHSKESQMERFNKLNEWYDNGGGLLLPFKATDRLIGAINILENAAQDKLTNEQLKQLKTDLSWLRNEI